MRRIFIAAALFGLIVGCAAQPPVKAERGTPASTQPDIVRKYFTLTAEQERSAKDAVLATLKDPESARFQSVVGVGDPDGTGAFAVCGSVNAKNSYGGYVGNRLFAVAAGQVLLWDATGRSRSLDNSLILTLCKPNQ